MSSILFTSCSGPCTKKRTTTIRARVGCASRSSTMIGCVSWALNFVESTHTVLERFTHAKHICIDWWVKRCRTLARMSGPIRLSAWTTSTRPTPPSRPIARTICAARRIFTRGLDAPCQNGSQSRRHYRLDAQKPLLCRRLWAFRLVESNGNARPCLRRSPGWTIIESRLVLDLESCTPPIRFRRCQSREACMFCERGYE